MSPVWWCLPFSLHPQLSCWLPRASVGFRDIGMSTWEFSLLLRFGRCSPSIRGTGSISTWDVHMLILVHFCSSLCSHISTRLQLLLLKVMLVSSGLSSVSSVTVASSLMGFPVSLDQCGVAQPPPLMLGGLWMCYWLSFCPTAAASIFDISSGLCQFCYGFSTGKFLFQS